VLSRLELFDRVELGSMVVFVVELGVTVGVMTGVMTGVITGAITGI
jgi:hypothetical protein